MTILVTDLALAPLAPAIGQGSQIMEALMRAVIGGFMVSSIIVLVFMPVLHRWLDVCGRLAGTAE
jgi:Cu/Ag efflux pump CusA